MCMIGQQRAYGFWFWFANAMAIFTYFRVGGSVKWAIIEVVVADSVDING